MLAQIRGSVILRLQPRRLKSVGEAGRERVSGGCMDEAGEGGLRERVGCMEALLSRAPCLQHTAVLSTKTHCTMCQAMEIGIWKYNRNMEIGIKKS